MQKYHSHTYTLITCLLAIMTATTQLNAATAKISIKKLNAKYNNKRPLVVFSDIDFAPYEFIGDNGSPQGYSVDITHLVLEQIGIPHTHKMTEWKIVKQQFEKKHADLIIDFRDTTQKNVFYSKMPIGQYRLAALSAKGSNNIQQFSDLPQSGGRVFFKQKDLGEEIARKFKWYDDNIINLTAQHAVSFVGDHPGTYYIWGYHQLKWLTQQNNATNLQIQLLEDVKSRPLCFASHDSLLIDAINDAFAQVTQSGKIETLHNKFFNHETKKWHVPHPLMLLIGLLTIGIVAFIFINYILIYHIRRKNQRIKLFTNMMEEAINSNHICIQDYNIKEQRSINIMGDYFENGGNHKEEFFRKMMPEDREMAADIIKRMAKGETEREECVYRRINPDTGQINAYNYCLLVALKNQEGNVTDLIYSIKEITGQVKQQEQQNEETIKFKQIFDRSLVGLAIYDIKGNFIEANEKMNELCDKKIIESFDMRKANLFALQHIHNQYDPQQQKDFSYCKINIKDKKGYTSSVEVNISTGYDAQQQPTYITISAYDVTEERNLSNELKHRKNNIKATKEQYNNYSQQLQSILKLTKAWLYQYGFHERMLCLYQEPGVLESAIPIEHFYQDLLSKDETEMKKTFSVINNQQDFAEQWNNTSHITYKSRSLTDENDDTMHYYTAFVIPYKDQEGNIVGSSGLIRDVTETYNLHEQLKKETKRAYASGIQKSAFLANMNHEIRTPLNSIVGFSELLQTQDSAEDRSQFIKIIRTNSDMLLRLISDILETSEINSGTLEIKPQEVDFSALFHKACQSLCQRIDNPNVKFICNNPYQHLQANVDPERITQVLNNFVTNAVKYTQKGYIRIGYNTEQQGIRIYCEDTGAGIPKQQQQTIFERFVKLNSFVQGTGLGLNICKSIAEACGGKIGVESEEGKGSTFWIWIPQENID